MDVVFAWRTWTVKVIDTANSFYNQCIVIHGCSIRLLKQEFPDLRMDCITKLTVESIIKYLNFLPVLSNLVMPTNKRSACAVGKKVHYMI